MARTPRSSAATAAARPGGARPGVGRTGRQTAAKPASATEAATEGPAHDSSGKDRTNPGAGERIRTARRAAGLTQDGLASAVGVSRSAVAQWETDRSGQVGGNLARIAAVLGVAVEYLLTGNTPREGGRGAENATEMALLRLYRSCTEDDRAFLLRTATRLARQAGRERATRPARD